MKKVALFAVLFFGFMAHASSDSFVSLVEKNLNDFFGDTLSEGETSAEVLKIQNKPQIKCSNVVFNKGRKIVFCTAEIETTYGENRGSHGKATCTSLGFILDKKGQPETQFNSELFQKCIEKISDASYD